MLFPLDVIQPSLEKFRHEKKYYLNGDNPKKIELLLKLHPQIFSQIYYERVVHNIYFDTTEFADYYDNVYGATDRKKVRLRWYSFSQKIMPPPSLITPQLEIKIKQNEATKKLVFSDDFSLTSTYQLLPSSLQKILPQPATLTSTTQQHQYLPQLQHLKPTLYNSYRRSYYLSADEQIRATIDADLEFRAINSQRVDTAFAIQPEITILELKSPLTSFPALTNAAKYLPFRRQRMSKYALGLSHLELHDY